MIKDSFEKALGELELMANKIKEPNTNLEESIKCYEQGMKQYKVCNEILNDAKQKIDFYKKEEVND